MHIKSPVSSAPHSIGNHIVTYVCCHIFPNKQYVVCWCVSRLYCWGLAAPSVSKVVVLRQSLYPWLYPRRVVGAPIRYFVGSFRLEFDEKKHIFGCDSSAYNTTKGKGVIFQQLLYWKVIECGAVWVHFWKLIHSNTTYRILFSIAKRWELPIIHTYCIFESEALQAVVEFCSADHWTEQNRIEYQHWGE